MQRLVKKASHEVLQEFHDRNGVSIRDHSYAAPMLLVLMRHVGCPFCRQALHELSESMSHITGCGYRVGLVHMEKDATVVPVLNRFNLANLPRFADPDRRLYKALGLARTNMLAPLFSRDAWTRGSQACRAHGAALPKADPLQLPGAFLVDQGVVVAGEAVLSPQETPDFIALLIRSEAAA